MGRGGRVFTPPETLEYEAKVREAAERSIPVPIDVDELTVVIDIFLKGKRNADIDNYCKSILDGANRIAYIDDKQIKHLHAHIWPVDDKADERVEVTIQVTETEAA